MIYDDIVLDFGDPMRDEMEEPAKFEPWEFIPKPSLKELADTLSGGDWALLADAMDKAITERTMRIIAAKDDTQTFERITEEEGDTDGLQQHEQLGGS